MTQEEGIGFTVFL